MTILHHEVLVEERVSVAARCSARGIKFYPHTLYLTTRESYNVINSDWIYQKSTSLVTVSTFILFLVFTTTILPIQSEQAKAQSGNTSPDMSFFLTVKELYEIAKSYGENGRFVYVRARFTFDLVWPIVYTLFLASGISWLYSRSFSKDSIVRRTNLVPVIGMVLDNIENIIASIVMLRYPARTPIVDMATVIVTPLKWVFVGGSFLVLVVGLVKYGSIKVRNVVTY